MASVKEIIEYSKANPQSDYAKRAYEVLQSGGFDKQAVAEGIDLSPLGRPKQPTKPAGVIESIKGDVSQRFSNAKEEINNTTQNPIVSGFKAIKEIAGTIPDVAGDLIAPVGRAIEENNKDNPIYQKSKARAEEGINQFKDVKDKIVDSQTFAAIGQKLNKIAADNPNLEKGVYDTLNILSAGGSIADAILAVEGGASIASKLKEVAPELLETAKTKASSAIENVTSAVTPESSTIMNRVARLKPSDATKFEDLAGKTHGEYLSETGNFGTPDKIVSNEATKFSQSIKSVDDELAKLPGVYKDGSITDALTGLVEKGKAQSGTNVKSPFLVQAEHLLEKSASEGLTMAEINEAKRLYERNVKLGYNKLVNADEVAKSTTIDSALREWQVNKAKELGFNNISELNKQTQISKFIIDKLGDEIVGKSGLNGVNLSDWVILAKGDPTAVAGFLTKKFFSSKSVQSKIAELLSRGDKQGIIKPDVTFSPENVKRQVSPNGLLELPEGRGNPSLRQDMSTIIPSIIEDEAAAARSTNTTINKTGDAYVKDRKTGKTKIITNQSIKNYNPTVGKTVDSALMQEAKKYKSAEEFVQKRLAIKDIETNKSSDEVLGTSFKFDFGQGKAVNGTLRETPNEIYLNTIGTKDFSKQGYPTVKGSGAGTKVINSLKEYADLTGKKLVVPDATGNALSFWEKIPWLKRDYGIKIQIDGKDYNPSNTFSYTPKSQLTDLYNKAVGKTKTAK